MAAGNKVLLGIADSFIDAEEDVNAGWTTNKFGGIPNWMQECFPSHHPKCGTCNGLLYLLAQIYCPLEGDERHRTLYVFGCIRKDCRNKQGSWAALRCQFMEKKETNEMKVGKVDESITQDIWCADADDWGIDDENNEMEKVDSKFGSMAMANHDEMESNSVSSAKQTGSMRNDLYLTLFKDHPPCFRPTYIHVLEEPESSSVDCFDYEFRLLRDYEAREGVVQEESTSKGKSSEKYEKTTVADGDRAFHKFQKRIRLCKEQCLRYNRNGDPLMLSDKVKPNISIDNIPPCSNCGSARVFEVQLMPALVSHLSRADEEGVPQGPCMFDEETRIDFGTIFTYTCRKSCDKVNNDGGLVPVEEFIAVQPSPDSEAFQTL